MAKDSKLTVEIQAVADQFQAQMAESADTVKRLSFALKQLGAQPQPSFTPATKSVQGFDAALKMQKRSLNGQMAIASLLTREMSYLGASVGKAGQVFSMFGASLMMGGGLGIAVAGVQALVAIYQQLTASSRELEEITKKNDEAFKKLSDTLQNEYLKVCDDVLIAQQKLLNQTPGENTIFALGLKQARALNVELAALSTAAAAFDLARRGRMTGETSLGDYDKAEQEFLAAQARVNLLRKEQDRIAAKEIEKAQLDEQAAQEERDKKFYADGQKLIEADLSKRQEKAREKIEKFNAWTITNAEGVSQAIREAQNEQDNAFLEGRKNAELTVLEQKKELDLISSTSSIDTAEQTAIKELEIERAFLEQKRALVLDDAERYAQVNAQIEINKAKATKAATEKVKTDITKMGEVSKGVGQMIGQSFADVAAGTKTAGEAIKSIFADAMGMVLDKILEVATAQITAAALKTGAENASAVGGIPIIGPVLSIGAMAAGIALVKGLLSQLPSAATGWQDVPRDMLAQIHAGETIVPAYDSAEVRDRLGGGSKVTINVSAVDAKGFDRLLTDRSSELSRALRNIERLGR